MDFSGFSGFDCLLYGRGGARRGGGEAEAEAEARRRRRRRRGGGEATAARRGGATAAPRRPRAAGISDAFFQTAENTFPSTSGLVGYFITHYRIC